MTLAFKPTAAPALTRFTALASLLRLEEPWTALQQTDPDSNVFSSWQWSAPAARHFADANGLNVLLVEEDGAPIALAPLARRHHLGLRALMLIGGGLQDYSMADYGDFLIAPGRAQVALEAIVSELDRDGSWDELWLQELPESSRTADLLPDLARRRGWHVDIRPASETYTVELPSTPEEYLARLSQNTRKTLRRRWNKLSREHQGAYHTVAADEGPWPALEALFDLHTRRWQHEGQGGIFKREATRAFHRDAVRGLQQAGMLDLTLLNTGETPIAAQYCLDFNGKRLFYINGHEPGAEWQSFGLGLLTDVARVEAAICAGLSVADFGRSEGEYKARYAPRRNQNLHLRIFRSRAAYLRCTAYLTAREAIKPAAKKLIAALRRRRAATTTHSTEEES